MGGEPIQIVKDQCLRLGRAYFDRKSKTNSNVDLVTIPFESDCSIMNA